MGSQNNICQPIRIDGVFGTPKIPPSYGRKRLFSIDRNLTTVGSVLLVGTYRLCGSWSVAGLNDRKVIGRDREVYFPQYNKIYVGLNDSNKTKWRVAGKAQGPS